MTGRNVNGQSEKNVIPGNELAADTCAKHMRDIKHKARGGIQDLGFARLRRPGAALRLGDDA